MNQKLLTEQSIPPPPYLKSTPSPQNVNEDMRRRTIMMHCVVYVILNKHSFESFMFGSSPQYTAIDLLLLFLLLIVVFVSFFSFGILFHFIWHSVAYMGGGVKASSIIIYSNMNKTAQGEEREPAVSLHRCSPKRNKVMFQSPWLQFICCNLSPTWSFHHEATLCTCHRKILHFCTMRPWRIYPVLFAI